MRRCWGVGTWEASGMWARGMWEVTSTRERLRSATAGRAHFGKGAADINLVGLTLDP